MPNSRVSLPALLALLAAMLLWGSSFVAQKLAFMNFHPFHVVLGRLLIASVGFLFFWRQFRKVQIRGQDWLWLLVMALCEPCLYFVFESLALTYTSASQAGMITSTLPMLVFAGAYLLFQERLTRLMFAGCLLAIVGAVGLSLAGDSTTEAPNPLLGNFLEFLAMVGATGYTLALKHLSARFSPAFLTALQALVGALFFAPFAWIFPWPQQFQWVPSLAIVYLGVAVSMGAYGLYNYGVSQVPASLASTFINLIPVFTLLLAHLVLNEHLNTLQWLACGLVFLGVFISQSGRGAKTLAVDVAEAPAIAPPPAVSVQPFK